MSRAGMPRSVNPGEPSSRRTFPDSRSTGVARAICWNRFNGAAWKTGTSFVRSSRTTKSSGTANAAWSLSPRARVERYVSAKSASPRLMTRNATATAARPGLRASESAASRTGTGALRPRRSSARSAGVKTRDQTTAATKAISAGSNSRTAPVPRSSARAAVSAAPRASASTTASRAPSAATSISLCAALARSESKTTSAATTAIATASATPRHDATECARTAPAGTPARLATRAPAALPIAQPASAPASATTPVSAIEPTTSCQRRAPNHVRRRQCASASRRSPVAASTAKASSSAAASPPINNSLRPATLPFSFAVRSCATGAVRSNRSDFACNAERVCATVRAKLSRDHGCTAPGCSGAAQV